MPGHEKIDSITNAPDSTKPMLSAISGDDGQQRVRHGVLAHHAPARQADRAARRDEVLAEHVEQVRPHDHRVLREQAGGERGDRQEQRA